MLAKSTAEILKTTIAGDSQVTIALLCTLVFWLCLTLLGCCVSHFHTLCSALLFCLWQLKYFFTYVILVGMFFTIAMEQHWLATGLKFFDALYVVPVFQAFFIGVRYAQGTASVA